MLILAADTSTECMGAAIWEDGSLVAEKVLDIGLKHAVTFMPAVDELLSRAGLKPGDIDAFACTVGPGSFTGIRIGISAVKGMAFASGKPAVGVSTLEVMARNADGGKGRIICPMLDARNDRIYASAWLGEKEAVIGNNWQVSEFFNAVRKIEYPEYEINEVYILGSGKETLRRNNLIPDDLPVLKAPPYLDYPRPAVVAYLAELRLLAGEEGNADLVLPVYLGPSQAERMAGLQNNDAS